jgi:hypothetical protein
MIREQNCKVPGCPTPAHARGYCRRHYGQMWRNGQITPDTGVPKTERSAPGPVGLQISGLRSCLGEAESIYERVTGLPNRLRWARRIRELKAQIEQLDQKVKKEGVVA